jgi:hypothetical protein
MTLSTLFTIDMLGSLVVMAAVLTAISWLLIEDDDK